MVVMQFYHKISLFLVGLTFAGCTNGPGNKQITGFADPDSGNSLVSPLEENFDCPFEDNVTPMEDWMLDGSGHFEVCPSKKNAAEILIHGQTYASDTICVFPVEWIDSSSVFVKPDLTNGAILYKCGKATSKGTTVKFENTDYNSVFIVESPYVQQFLKCAEGKDVCPETPYTGYYSFGKFR